MNKFVNAMLTNDRLTENGMPIHSTSGEAVLDLFYKMGGMRKAVETDLIVPFVAALEEDTLLALKAMFYNRNIRGGQGERRSFRIMFRYLCEQYPQAAIANLKNVPVFGRWDDIFVAFGTKAEIPALDLIKLALDNGDGLCAKWMPREGKSNSALARKIAKHLGLSMKLYRKLLAASTKVVENSMCAREWGAINYNHVPSIASKIYRFAFGRHDNARYATWLESLKDEKSGNKIHADAIFPHSIVSSYTTGVYSLRNVDNTLEAQWKALPDYVPDGESFIPVCDLSGSMTGEPMCVSAALGIYLSERNKGPFKDAYITFSRVPTLHYLKGNLRDKLVGMRLGSIAENTNYQAVFEMILSKAKESGLSQEDMPKTILVISDMQFDQAQGYGHFGKNAMKLVRDMYGSAGYTCPNMVFWNVRTSEGVPVKSHESGAALVSGFSPSIMKNLLQGEMTPMGVMLKTLNDPMYDCVVLK